MSVSRETTGARGEESSITIGEGNWSPQKRQNREVACLLLICPWLIPASGQIDFMVAMVGWIRQNKEEQMKTISASGGVCINSGDD
jgi:hypothetical protein